MPAKLARPPKLPIRSRYPESIGFNVEVQPAKTVQSLEGFQAVVLGSAVRIGQWVSDAKNFVEQYQARLAKMRWRFSRYTWKTWAMMMPAIRHAKLTPRGA
jgi:menaquinone-dependent protoporphyrinogen IX oxidase